MKVYFWDNVLKDYTSGMMVVVASSVEEARETLLKECSYIPKEDLEAVIVLNDPIYIINGMMYTEEELFGPNPTSPYAPLHKQDIISTTIMQEEDALIAYGEKGKKGVVIIKTKEGKPKK